MTDQNLPDQDTATLALMMNHEVDKRVMVALSRAIEPTNQRREQDIERAYDSMKPDAVQSIVRGMLIDFILSDGSLMHTIRSKLSEHFPRNY